MTFEKPPASLYKPRKEVQRSQSYTRRRQQRGILRVVLFVFTVAVFYAVIVQWDDVINPEPARASAEPDVDNGESVSGRVYQGPRRPAEQRPELLEPKHEEVVERGTIPGGTPAQQIIAMAEEVDKVEGLDSDRHTVGGSSKDTNRIGETDDKKLFEALQKVLSMIPDEMHIAELLRPIQGSGNMRLRELGLRTRQYKRLFEAWESLHLVHSGDSIYIRDDIIQRLRSQANSQDERLQTALTSTIHSYELFRSTLTSLADILYPSTSPYFADHMTLHTHSHSGGRGIVASAGNDQAPYLLTTLTVLRNLGCTLPIEVMYLGPLDLDEEYRDRLERIPGVLTRDVRSMVRDDGWEIKGWAGKPWSILLSSFREVVFLDADVLFFQNPEILFKDPGYVETGALFFHDRLMMAENKRSWLSQILPKPISGMAKKSRLWTGQSGHMQESGVVVVDKWKHFMSLLLVCRMNGPDRDGNGNGVVGVYDLVYGDKETFWLGFELAGDSAYSFHRGGNGIMGAISPPEEPRSPKDSSRFSAPKATSKPKSKTSSFSANTTIPTLSTPSSSSIATAIPTHKICAPQLLHLSTSNTPLWFNGWIISNKFNKAHSKVVSFESYMIEPDYLVPGRDEQWKLGADNLCCLTGTELFEFTGKEREVLEKIVEVAKEIGAYIDPEA